MSSTTAPGATDSVDFFGNACVMPRPWTLGWVGRISFYSSIGTLLILANFPKFLTTLVMVNVSNPDWQAALLVPLQVVQSTLWLVIGGQPLQFFERTMTAAFLFSWLFFGTLTLFCVRRRSFRMLLYSGMGLIAGFFVLHMAAWIAATVVVTVSGVIYVGRWVAGGIEAFVGFLVSNGWVFGGLGLLVAIALLRSQFALMARLFARYFVQIFGGVALLVVLAFAVPAFYNWVIAPVLKFFWRLLTPLLAWGASLFRWIAALVATVVVVAGGLFALAIALATLGSLLVSQLQAGWHAARSNRHALIAGFAIGGCLGFVVLVSIATPGVAFALNAGWDNVLGLVGFGKESASTFMTDAFQSLLPGTVTGFVFTHLTDIQAPALDGLVFATVMAAAFVSGMNRLFSSTAAQVEEVPVKFIALEFGKMALGTLAAVLLVFLAAVTGDSDA